MSKAELNRAIDNQILQHELLEDNEDYLTSAEFCRINFKYGIPAFFSDLIHYLTGKYLPYDPHLIEEEVEKERIKQANLVAIAEREICPGPYFDAELENIRTGMNP